MNILRKLLLFITIQSSVQVWYGQDMHFSQATNFPLLINPAFSGVYNAKSRAIFSARNQNIQVPNSAFSGVYNTLGASFETKIFEEMTGQNTWSIGVMGLSDYAGSGTLATNQFLVSSGYSLSMDRYGQSFLSLAGQIGITNRRIFSKDLLFETQISEFNFDPRLPNLEPYIDGNSRSNFMLNIGALYQQQISDRAVCQLGLSLYNVNNPEVLFYSNSSENIYTRFNANGGVLFQLDDYTKLYPSIIFMKQGSFTSTNIGMSYSKDISDEVSISGGVRTRLGDAFILVAGMKYKNFYSTVSYDVTTSGLSKANKSMGALELNLTFLFGEAKEGYHSDKLYCPSF